MIIKITANISANGLKWPKPQTLLQHSASSDICYSFPAEENTTTYISMNHVSS